MDTLLILVAILVVLAVFLWFIRKLILKRYFHTNSGYDGQIVITTDIDGKKIFSLELDKDPEEIEKQDIIVFKVSGHKSVGYEDV